MKRRAEIRKEIAALEAELRELRYKEKKLAATATMPHPQRYNNGTKIAQMRATQLLWEYLTPLQRTEWAEYRYISVFGNISQRRYRITASGVVRTSDARNFCLVFTGSYDERQGLIDGGFDWQIPIEDQVLAKKLLLEHDERTFLRTAHPPEHI